MKTSYNTGYEKPDWKRWGPFYITLLVSLVVVLGLWGFHNMRERYAFNPFAALYDTLLMFKMESREPIELNWQLLAARYLAAAIVGYGLYLLIVEHLKKWWFRLRILTVYRDHTIIAGLGFKGYLLATDLAESGEKVIIIQDKPGSIYLQKVRKKGIIVLIASATEKKSWVNAGLLTAKQFFLVMGSDETNIEAALIIKGLCHRRLHKKPVTGYVHIENLQNYNLLKDYMDMEHGTTKLDLNIFSANILAAQRIWDLYPPHFTPNSESPGGNISILLAGYNETAESFLIENMILSHYRDPEKLTVYVLIPDAQQLEHQLKYRYPFMNDFLDCRFIEQTDELFYTEPDLHPDEFRKISKVYVFGENDSEVVLKAKSLRQYFYTMFIAADEDQTTCMQKPGFIVCLPEKTSIMNLLNIRNSCEKSLKEEQFGGNVHPTLVDQFSEYLNIHFFRLYTDSLKKEVLMDQHQINTMVAKVINYHYVITWLMKPKLEQITGIEGKEISDFIERTEHKFLEIELIGDDPLQEIEDMVLNDIRSEFHLTPEVSLEDFRINTCWHDLSDRLEDSNLYSARHARIKMLYPFDSESQISQLAPMEHLRWMAEKMAFQFRYGELPETKTEKNLIKKQLKINDLIIPFTDLNETDREKDYNLFRILGLVRQIMDSVTNRKNQPC